MGGGRGRRGGGGGGVFPAEACHMPQKLSIRIIGGIQNMHEDFCYISSI